MVTTEYLYFTITKKLSKKNKKSSHDNVRNSLQFWNIAVDLCAATELFMIQRFLGAIIFLLSSVKFHVAISDKLYFWVVSYFKCHMAQ